MKNMKSMKGGRGVRRVLACMLAAALSGSCSFTGGCPFFRTIGILPLTFENGTRAYFKFVAMPSEALIVLTLTEEACRPPSRSDDYLFQEWATGVWYSVKGNTLLLYGTTPTTPTRRKWPVAIEYHDVDQRNPLAISEFHRTTVPQKGLTYLLMPDRRVECFW